MSLYLHRNSNSLLDKSIDQAGWWNRCQTKVPFFSAVVIVTYITLYSRRRLCLKIGISSNCALWEMRVVQLHNSIELWLDFLFFQISHQDPEPVRVWQEMNTQFFYVSCLDNPVVQHEAI